ncbi:FAD-dependent monooxygenase [Nocardia alni]|uniref:FAD-dependent monooxygenase n=1 Tax=Nocardia alni TaxID=2815723 RepID=UPI001C24370D|nr:FAD-dependent monooxygenase [Nocardia alni]
MTTAEPDNDDIETTAEVLIAGAGPVGLMLAGELALAGVHAVVVEASAHPHGEEKARGVGVLGAEALRRRGLGTRLRMPFRPGRPDTAWYMGQHQSHFAWIHKFDHGSMREPGRTPAVIFQPELEQLLAEHARDLGVRIHRGYTVVELASHDDRILTSTQTRHGQREFTSRYVVGCDGGHSDVRKLWNFDFPGVAPTGVHLMARLKVEDPTRLPAEMEGPKGAFASRGPRDGWMGVRMSEPVDGGERGPRDPLTIEEIRDAIRRVTGVDIAITEMEGARRGYDNSRQAGTYRLGRVFLAGDAAHVHSPLGGQGLNLGLMDAVNLGWKLAYAVRGAVNAEDLLDSYTRERHPVGAAVLHNTRAQTALLAPTPHAQAMRDIVSDLLDIHEVKVFFNEMMTGTAIRYPLPHTVGDHPLLGGHIGNVVIDDTSLYTLMADGRPLLIHHVALTDIASVAQPWADRVHIHSALTLDRTDLAAALIRPDGVVVWAAEPRTPPDPQTLLDALATWFGPASTQK